MKESPGASCLGEANLHEVCRALQALEADSGGMNRLEKLLDPFNIFDVLRNAHNEIRHSNVLAWLLDPLQNHALSYAFLRSWVSEIIKDSNLHGPGVATLKTIPDLKILRVKVEREWKGDSDGTLSLDLLIRIWCTNGTRIVLGIENKVRSTQQVDQLKDYRQMVERCFPSSAKRIFLFLSKDREMPNDPAFIPTTYQPLALALDGCLKNSSKKIAKGPQQLLSNYLSILKTRFMSSSTCSQIALRFYEEHRKALDFIFEIKPDERSDLSNLVEKAMVKSAKAWGIIPLPADKRILRFIPEAWNVPSNCDDGDTEWWNVFCQVELLSGVPNMIATTWPEVDKTGQINATALRLYQAASRKEFKGATMSKLRTAWYCFYRIKCPTISIDDLAIDNLLPLNKEIMGWVKATLQDPDFKKMTDVVSQILSNEKRKTRKK